MLIVLPNELEILRTMQPLDRDVFHYLAERVDYESGIIGRARRVSYGGMAFDLSEREGERRKKETLRTVTSKQIENAVSRLVRCGLLVRKSKNGVGNDLVLERVFWVHELNSHQSEQKPDGRQMGAQLGALNKIFNNKNKDIQENKESSWEAKPQPDGTTSFTCCRQEGDERFLMTLDWTPTENEFDMMLFRAGKRKEDVKPEWITEFIGYWHAEATRSYHQREWTYRLAMRMIDYLRDPDLYERRHGSMPTPAKTAKSKSGLPDWANPPQDNDKLGAWMRKHGYGDGPPGMQLFQTRAWLRAVIEPKLKDYRRLS